MTLSQIMCYIYPSECFTLCSFYLLPYVLFIDFFSYFLIYLFLYSFNLFVLLSFIFLFTKLFPLFFLYFNDFFISVNLGVYLTIIFRNFVFLYFIFLFLLSSFYFLLEFAIEVTFYCVVCKSFLFIP